MNHRPCEVNITCVFWVCHTTEKCVINHPAKFQCLKKQIKYQIKLVKYTLMYSSPAIHEQCWSCMLSSAAVIWDIVNPLFELPTVFIIKYFINPSTEYLILIWWLQKCVKTWWDEVFTQTALIVRAWATLFVCLSKGAFFLIIAIKTF